MRVVTNRSLKTAILVASITLLVALGCQVFQSLAGHSGPSFSHRFHVKEKKLGCEDCHADAATSPQAGMPAPETCAPCHAEKDKEKPPARRSSVFFPEGAAPAWTNQKKLPEEVKFSHQYHLDKGAVCADCHKGIEDSESVSPHPPMSMKECMACHAEKKAPVECETCHKQIRKDSPPENHRLNWLAFHGQEARAGHDQLRQCLLCHTEENCSRCHDETKPRDHTNFWRIRGHGAVAELDRDRCQACHKTDYCERCHHDTAPMSHTGAWGATQDRHCLSCHTPIRAEPQCSICHKSTPSHSLAAPKPSWHTPAMNCRQCHGVSQPLPHADNGSNCNSCHM